MSIQTAFPPAGLTASVGRQRYHVTSWAQVSAAYRSTIEQLDLGASETPPCLIEDASGQPVAHVSYNGKVWRGASWRPDDTPIYIAS